MTSRYAALSHLLARLQTDVEAGVIDFTSPSGNEGTLCASDWRGCKAVWVRYDCVNFWDAAGKGVEARISRLPADLAERVRRIWLEIDPQGGSIESFWTTVRTHK